MNDHPLQYKNDTIRLIITNINELKIASDPVVAHPAEVVSSALQAVLWTAFL